MAVHVMGENGQFVIDEVGEMVMTQPAPSMPVGFWNDKNDERYIETYFSDFPGMWRQGDFYQINQRGGAYVLGRSDATLNRHGIRIGTSEIYRTIVLVPGVEDGLIVNLDLPGGKFFMPLFVKLADGVTLDEAHDQAHQRPVAQRVHAAACPGQDLPGAGHSLHHQRQAHGSAGAAHPVGLSAGQGRQPRRHGQSGGAGFLHRVRPHADRLPDVARHGPPAATRLLHVNRLLDPGAVQIVSMAPAHFRSPPPRTLYPRAVRSGPVPDRAAALITTTFEIVSGGDNDPNRLLVWFRSRIACRCDPGIGAARPGRGARRSTPKEEDEELSEVQVTGTRIQSPNVTSPNPITTITGEEMRRLGIVNVADALTQLVPQNISTYQPGADRRQPGQRRRRNWAIIGDSGGGGNRDLDRGSFFIGNTIANLRGLDPAFGSRTLTLIDGRRAVSTSNQADVVDLNIIPSNLLERMDVVTGGASATYGSGAMAGVVNLVLGRRTDRHQPRHGLRRQRSRRRQQPARLAVRRHAAVRRQGPRAGRRASGRTQPPSATAPRRATGAPNRAPCSRNSRRFAVERRGRADAAAGLRGPAGALPDGERALQPVLAQRRDLREQHQHRSELAPAHFRDRFTAGRHGASNEFAYGFRGASQRFELHR